MSDMTFFASSAFKLKRPAFTTNGITSEVDAAVQAELTGLNALLDRRIFPPVHAKHHKGDDGRMQQAAPEGIRTAVVGLLTRPLTPRHTPKHTGAEWDKHSLGEALSTAQELPDGLTLSEFIDMTAQLSALKYDFQNTLSENWVNLDYNTTKALDDLPGIVDYLIAYGNLVMNMTEVHGLANFVFSNSLGVKHVVNFAIVGAARTIVDHEQLNVPGINDNDPKTAGSVVGRILAGNLTISSASFASSLKAIIDDFVFNHGVYAIIDAAKLDLSPSVKAKLIPLVKALGPTITTQNAVYFLPALVAQLTPAVAVAPGDGTPAPGSSISDFDVQYLADDQAVVKVSQAAVRCAAQLYYSMVLGDEFDVLNAINYFTHKYLIRGNIEIADSQLRDDLQLYVFSNKFIDLRSKRINDRSRPAERQMFYRQVFNWGHGQITEDVIVNREFTKLWKVLMLESAKYIERAQISPNPDSFVSRQNVMQAVEDLQYNLSTHCTGMANVITPLIYAELDFVIQRILMHPDIVRQVVPQGGTWWRVVETLYIGMKNVRPRSTVLYNKAKLGDQILRSIADYNSSTFEQDGPFSAFVSLVDAFITTQSILQRGLTEDLIHGDADSDADDVKLPDAAANGVPKDANGAMVPAIGSSPPSTSSNGVASGGDEWAF
jgi:hypothetical protein